MIAMPEQIDSLAVFVNSSDGFQDCWPPFFELYRRYAGTLRNLPLYLNTERVRCTVAEPGAIATAVWPQTEGKRPTWSECLKRGLHCVRETYVLYLHEDYFLTRQVDDARIAAALEILRRDDSVGVIYLNQYGPQFRHSRPHSSGVVEVCRPARYLASTQAAIWRKQFLVSLLRPWENGWTFEKCASLRIRRSSARILSVSPEVMACHPVIDYVYTGVMKGRWNPDCVPLFDEHGIPVDFARRGFYCERGRWKSRLEVLGKIMASPQSALRSVVSLVRP